MEIKNRLKRYFFWRVLDISLRRSAPTLLSLSNKELNAYAVYLTGVDGSNQFLADEFHEFGVSGKWWSAGKARFEEPCSVPHTCLHMFNIDMRYFYKGWTFHIQSASSFLILFHFLKYAFWVVAYSKVRQIFFNRHRLTRRDRMKVLNHIFSETLNRHDYRAYHTELLTKFYSIQWVRHPQKEELLRYYSLLLESLAESGELKKDGATYVLAAGALNTIAAYELEERRHRDNYRVQSGIFALTFVLALIGIAQAYAALKG
ncbi:hypothetical protein [Agrobacterium tumefaciens]|uniref:hypothetical protein n=1 Tax=Agrobacterium tumefaciens TaxID=358 RepID=UPI0021D1E406|nr:hypothetical protein [Agrobacterium tumefaciens]UXS26949.1 hypothetical protein FY153_21040 [Agrobacterium tumefaciens]UXS54552.1 hypothetical protein FY148_17730 [Agrobacterium tumefaciens]UXS65475.1 hypothetical protein FY147_21465 [Agrobacterium tumefaciens]